MGADRLVKNPSVQLVNQHETLVAPSGFFNVQTNRITSRQETYLKIKGAFKIVVENKGDVDVIIFGNYPLPSYSKEVFETGDTSLSFSSDTLIAYTETGVEGTISENVNLLLTSYYKTK